MTTKLQRSKQKAQAWRREYENLRGFMNRIVKIAVKRERGYAARMHGDILNKSCMDWVVAECKDFHPDRFNGSGDIGERS